MSERFSDRRLSLPALGLLAGTMLPGNAEAQEHYPKVDLTEVSDAELLEREIVVDGTILIEKSNHSVTGIADPYMKDEGNGLEVAYLDVKTKTSRACLLVDHVLDAGNHWRVDTSDVRITQPGMSCEAWQKDAGLPMIPFELNVDPKEEAQGAVEKVVKRVKMASPSTGFDPAQIGVQLGGGFYREERDMYDMWVNPAVDARVSVPLPAGFVVGPSMSFYIPSGESERSGLGAVGGFVGKDFDLFKQEELLRLYLDAGYAPDWHPALNAAYATLGVQVNVWDIAPIHSSLAANCEATRDFIGTGWFLTGDPAMGFSCAAALTVYPLAFVNLDSAPKPKPVVQEVPEIPAVVQAVEPEATEPLNLIQLIDRGSEVATRYMEELKKLSDKQAAYEAYMGVISPLPEVPPTPMTLSQTLASYESGALAATLDYSERGGAIYSYEKSYGVAILPYGYYVGDLEDNGKPLPVDAYANYGRVVITESGVSPFYEMPELQQGDWVEARWNQDGSPDGDGRMFHKGILFEGSFNDGKFTTGKVILPNGDIYRGRFDLKRFAPHEVEYIIQRGQTFLSNSEGSLVYTSEGPVPVRFDSTMKAFVFEHPAPSSLQAPDLETLHIDYLNGLLVALEWKSKLLEYKQQWFDASDQHTEAIESYYNRSKFPSADFSMNVVSAPENPPSQEQQVASVARLRHFFRARGIDEKRIGAQFEKGFELVSLTVANGVATLTVQSPEGSLIHYSAKYAEMVDRVHIGQEPIHEDMPEVLTETDPAQLALLEEAYKAGTVKDPLTEELSKEAFEAGRVIREGFKAPIFIRAQVKAEDRAYITPAIEEIFEEFAKEKTRKRK